MNRIQLHGLLADKYGEVPPMMVRDPAEAFRALSCQLPDFRGIIRDGDWWVVREDREGKFALDEETLYLGLDEGTIHIIPGVEGSANGKGIGKMILGLTLVAASIFVPAAAFGFQGLALGWSATMAGVSFGAIGLAGVSLALAGAALMLAPQPKMNDVNQGDDHNSFIFDGAVNPSGQGYAVPVIFGRMRVGAVPVATKIETNQLNVNSGQVINNPLTGTGTFHSVF